MIGTWIGFYKYDRNYFQKIIGFEKTIFTLIIISFDGTYFKGIVKDDPNTGGMNETGEIIGEINDNKVFFKKLMPKRQMIIDSKGTRKVTEKKHLPLYYYGSFSQDRMELSGHWEFKYKIAFLFGLIPIPFRPGKGTWSMKLET